MSPMSGKLPGVSAAESEVLRVLWELRQASVQAVCDALPPERSVTYATVQTLLRRLEKKGYVSRKTESKAHVFYPCVARERVLVQEVRRFVRRLFGGDPLPLMLNLAEDEGLDAKDVARLRQLVDAARRRRKDEH
jgi:BlaI family penicillinase repressor